MNPTDKTVKAARLIRREAEATRAAGGQVYMTSSFQTQSVPLLHIVASNGLDVSVLFIDTGYHFAETYGFVDALSRRFGIDVRWIGSSAQHAPLRDVLPMLAWTAGDVAAFDLPAHPLGEKGYTSIGCAPCTARPSSLARWSRSFCASDRCSDTMHACAPIRS